MANKKIGLFLILFFLIFLFAGAGKSLAQHDSGVGWYKYYGGNMEKFEEDVFGTEQFNQPSHAYSNMENVAASLNNFISGCQTEACQESLKGNSSGAIGTTTNLIGQIYANPPASGAIYFADLGQRLNLTQPAYAQSGGPGFSGLRPLLDLWKNFRNMAYIFFIFVFIFVGFAIMFRAKINPQTVVTIQSAIPKAVIALILVTFSYAIAGLMIDFMYLITGVLLAIINPQSFTQRVVEFLASLGLSAGPENPNIAVFSIYFWETAASIINNIGRGLSLARILNLPEELDIILNTFPGGITLTGNLLIELILGLILLFVFFKIFLSLIVCYVKVIINIIIAPIRLMIGAIPGQNSFGAWLRDLAVNLLPFPAVITMLALASELKTTSAENPLWIAPIIRPVSIFEITETTFGKYIGSILAFGVLLLTARVPDIIKGVFERKPFEYGTALGQAILPGPVKGAAKLGFYSGAEAGIEVVEGKAAAAGRTTGKDVAAARVARKLLGLKK